jgi:phosphate starvation-inducible PhoH-like protein
VAKSITREKLAFDDPQALQALCGSNNSRLKLIERTAGAEVHLRGNEITIEGERDAADTAKNAIEQLYDMALEGKPLSSDDVVRAVKLLQGDGQQTVAQVFGDTILTPRAGRPIAPKGATQKRYVDLVRGNDIVFAVGPAGTGKTYLAVAQAVSQLITGSVDRLILSRPAVEAGERLGFLPGDMKEKVDPYLRPLYDALYEMLPTEQVERRITSGEIEIAPLAFMRGRTLNDAFIILDEAQNTTPLQMKMFLTRFGMRSRMVICGDPHQVDLPDPTKSGLADAVDKLEGVKGIATVRFTAADVVRHPLVGRIVEAYEGPGR